MTAELKVEESVTFWTIPTVQSQKNIPILFGGGVHIHRYLFSNYRVAGTGS